MLKQTLVNHAFDFGVTDLIHELADGGSSVSASAQTANGRHPRVVPTGNQTFFDKLEHFTFGHHSVSDVQAVELALLGSIVWAVRRQACEVLAGYLVEEIVVERTVHLKLQCAYRVRNTLEIVALTMREVVHRIYVPLASRAVVRVRSDDTVHDRVAEVHVRVSHINLGTQNHLSFLNLAVLHSLEQTQVLLYRTVAIGRVRASFGRRAFLFSYLLGGLFVNVGFALFDETDSQIVECVEVVRGIENFAPLEAEPAYVAFDGINVLRVLLGRIGVVETEVTNAVVLFGDAEIHTYRLDVTYMQVAVRFRRETRLYASVVHSLSEVFFNNLLNKIEAAFLLFHIVICLFV